MGFINDSNGVFFGARITVNAVGRDPSGKDVQLSVEEN